MKRAAMERGLAERRAKVRGREDQANRYRKKDEHDCGQSNCGVCHFDKVFGHTVTKQEIDSELALEEQIEDMAVPADFLGEREDDWWYYFYKSEEQDFADANLERS